MNSTSALPQSPLLPTQVHLGPAYGTFLICTFLSLMFYGVALHQVYRYIRLHSSDGLVVKSYVILAVHMKWRLIFFAARVYKLDKRYRTLLAMAIIMFLVELAFTVKGFAIGTIDSLNKYAWMQSGGFGVVISADIMLTFVLALALHQRRTGFKITNSKIDLLIAYAIGTGLVTLIFAMACFITALASPGNLLFGALDLICVKVYINSVLATLNMRPSAASAGSGDRLGTIDLCALPQSRSAQNIEKEWPSSSTKSTNGVDPATVVSIKVTNDLSHRV
ncbi:uncharacterized protein TRAVEDRAFT_21340 [Trametes versicolor FP-101664 SS1]|uniref:uncharacterized protein n=1 Tax=Trametes versicolor (strain FP-101664) TaxID=717944 RepID=UPI0004623BBB|nr:uncharacterized protein TRAVEDRAFT_21340 [Trametes versicolor FP-101664 SS1]EIW57862.1 hypothetical protein TRAVEDRAFT_21340 [Trametes versicolor FP-101664 SS1]